MFQAIASAEKGMRRGNGGPFGAVLVRSGKVLATAHNRVLKERDATCHAEVNAIREASRKLKRFDLSDCEIYSTTEPCPMCFAAIHWAKIKAIYFGTSIADVKARGFNELSISNTKLKKAGKSRVKLKAGFMKGECLELLKKWDKLPKKRLY